MRVLVYEQYYKGHFYQYVHHILPLLTSLVDEVIVAVTAEGRKSPEFASLLKPFSDQVDIYSDVLRDDPGNGINQKIKTYYNLFDTVKRIRPDYVFIPSGDRHTLGAASSWLRGLSNKLPGNIPAEVGIHFGLGNVDVDFRDRIKAFIRYQSYLFSSWANIHFVNAFLYEKIQLKGGNLAHKAKMLPDPIPTNPRQDKIESRKRLGIPEDGHYIGIIGLLDERKAIDIFLEAFQGSFKNKERLLLAGELSPRFHKLIENNYKNLIHQERIILLNKYLTEQEFLLALSASDIICVPTLKGSPISSILLKGISAGRPILTNNNFGWSHAMVKKFQFGWACDLSDKEKLIQALHVIFECYEEYEESEATKRLLTFHQPENFAESWVAQLRVILGKPALKPIPDWNWVLEALPIQRQAL